MDYHKKYKISPKNFFVCSLTGHMRVYHSPQGEMEGGVSA